MKEYAPRRINSRPPFFRAWDREHEVMCEVWDIGWKTWDMYHPFRKEDGPPAINYVRVESSWSDGTYELLDGQVELMQWTQLSDKNQVPIFEGDILSDGAVVEWFESLTWDSGGSMHSGFYCEKWFQYGELSYRDGFDDCEVIGNIYEHLHLLKE